MESLSGEAAGRAYINFNAMQTQEKNYQIVSALSFLKYSLSKVGNTWKYVKSLHPKLSTRCIIWVFHSYMLQGTAEYELQNQLCKAAILKGVRSLVKLIEVVHFDSFNFTPMQMYFYYR